MSRNAQAGGEGVGGVEAKRAPVPPRVRVVPGTASLPIDRQVRALLAKKTRGVVRLIGPAGSGKSTALAHLAATIEPDAPVKTFDGPVTADFQSFCKTHLVIYTASSPAEAPPAGTLEISPWADEDLIEYLLATHAGRVRAVMGRVKGDLRAASLQGVAELWRIVLDEMAADDGVADVDAALSCFLARELFDVRVRDAAERSCLFSLAPWGITRPAVGFTLENRIERLVRFEPVKMILAAQRLTDGLRDRTVWDELKGRLPGELIDRCGKLAARCPAAVQTLDEMTCADDEEVHAMAASILHAGGGGWRPTRPRKVNLCSARLVGALWSTVNLSGSSMVRADLRNARLVGADLMDTDLSHAFLAAAILAQAKLSRAKLRQASLRRADLSGARMFDVALDGADLTEANLNHAILCGARLRQAILRGTSLQGTDLTEADLRNAVVDEADFSGANLTKAELAGLSLRSAVVGGACFKGADLTDCDLEEIEGPADFTDARLESALLTGSVMRGASFRGAVLRGCGLADVVWDGADLREADFRGSTFHMGSTRSGLVGSDIPCEGSRTGFYTDDYQDREFVDPRDIRKASLCNADLRGAHVHGVDFYLVDLRGARYTPEQAEWFARCGAITCGAGEQ